jgi:hypothetical protein
MDTMKIRIGIDGGTITGTFENTPAARDFVSLLPLTVTLEDHARTEKITYLPQALSTADAPERFTSSAGDISYYAPWGNLAIFYRAFHYSRGLIKRGEIETSGVAALSRFNSGQATIALVVGRR